MGELEHPFREIRVYTPRPLEAGVLLPPGAHNVVLPSTLPFGLWEQVVLPRTHGGAGLLLCPSYVVPLLAGCPTLLIHHGSYEGYPEAFPWWTRTRARIIYTVSARRATGIATVSEHSRREMVKYYGIGPDKVRVIPAGVDTRIFRPIADSRVKSQWRISTFGEDVPFLLYVGKPTKRRNLPSLIRAFGLLKLQHAIPHKLLLVGTALPGTPFQHVVTQLGLEREVFTLGFARHDQIALAYNAADLLVYPSSHEGFGMPVLEAMACGTPALALNNTAFPEFAGGIAHLVEDAEVETLSSGMARALDDTTWRARASQEGPLRAAFYDWRPITRQYISLMRELLPS
jgi:glycosyltransferase involved in cell wall biosynthesis